MDMDLKGKVAIVTGGGTGIGEAICLALAREGANIVIANRNIENAKLVLSEVKKMKVDGLALCTDVTKKKDVENMIRCVIDKFGKVDILVNNAGILHGVQIEDLKEDDWDKVVDTNLKSVFLCSKLVLIEMMKKKYGKIINISSMAGECGGIYSGVDYSAAKGGVIALTKCLALKGAGYDINVNSVAPGRIKTKSTEHLNFTSSGIPLGRIGAVEDVADTVVFLSSDRSSYITGATIDVNGGLLMR
ncbi:3-oxoacyl-ACP reductase FabG [Petroclostridium sp. X23]|uniref:SDR family NAD(P)-dependent oxidoreductase n=1 Tax=Petroclostridium sp. X23 TaxID=3045146 RepID=UPI0024ADCB5B|nr:3-oxoacyl-ACP reductase FabG [Petroclostridium sp. X23]WHH59010.1 3-oxoacyl-ACP reductase FabG [Petroclostridium sp. X23]